MSEKIHVLAQELFGKSTVEACELEEIRELVQRYPYFAPARFLLLQKLKSENNPDYGPQLQKAVLYYHNPLAFEYFIDGERFFTDISFEEQPVAEPPHLIEQDKVPEAPAPAIEEEPVNEVYPNNSSEIIEEAAENMIDPVEPAFDDHAVVANDALPAKEIVEETRVEEMPIAKNEALPMEEINENVPGTGTEIKIPSPAPLPENNNDNALSFEPFHTVDYFASQGIKLSQEEISKDKFGRQLKSFTEWLKTMKRLPVQAPALDASVEKNLEHLAEDSVHNPEVVTETMAEVWLKQGNREKAIETYNKLSLLNPLKRDYFAALIENLKRS